MKTAGENKENRKKKYKICTTGPPIIRQCRFVGKRLTGEDNPCPDFEEFIISHGMSGNDDYVNYHMSLGFYYVYFAEAMKYADMIDGGEVFDEIEVSIVIKNLDLAKRVFLHFRERLGVEIAPFDTAETVVMEECSLEKGEIVGNRGNALAIAKKWLNQFKKKGNMQYKEGFVEKSVSHAFFLYEVAVYIYYLLGEDISYEFLGEQKEKF